MTDPNGAAIYGVPWIPSIYPSHVSINIPAPARSVMGNGKCLLNFCGEISWKYRDIVWILWIHIHGFLTRRYRTYRIFHDISILVLLYWDILGWFLTRHIYDIMGISKWDFYPRPHDPHGLLPVSHLDAWNPRLLSRSVSEAFFLCKYLCHANDISGSFIWSHILHIYIYILFGIIIWFYMVWNLM